MNFRDFLRDNFVILDGGMGSLLQKRGLKPGEKPETYNILHPEMIIDIQKAYFDGTQGIVINPAGYTHTSVAILDALKATALKAVEVHISDVSSREDFRQISYVRGYVSKTISGKGLQGYIEAIDYLIDLIAAH